jgi:hypothetical protein
MTQLAAALPLALGAGASRAQQELLKESDDEAVATGYRADATQVDKAKFPKYAAGQTCANCSLYAPDGSKPSGGCALFYGKDVLAKGWCNAWEKKAG